MGITTLSILTIATAVLVLDLIYPLLDLEFGIGEEDMRILKDLFKDYRFTIGFIVLCLLVFLAIASFFRLMTLLNGCRSLGIDLLRGLTYWELF